MTTRRPKPDPSVLRGYRLLVLPWRFVPEEERELAIGFAHQLGRDAAAHDREMDARAYFTHVIVPALEAGLLYRDDADAWRLRLEDGCDDPRVRAFAGGVARARDGGAPPGDRGPG